MGLLLGDKYPLKVEYESPIMETFMSFVMKLLVQLLHSSSSFEHENMKIVSIRLNNDLIHFILLVEIL